MSQKKSRNSEQRKDPHKLILILAPFLLLAASFFLVRKAMDEVLVNAMDAFKASEDEMTSSTYENASEIYQAAAMAAELPAQRTITAGALKQAEKIEVFRVPVSETVTENKEDNEYGITSWLRLEETAVYTVNPSLSDIIIDEERGIVTLRISRLELELDEEEENVEKLLFRQETGIENDTDPSEAAALTEEKMIRSGRTKMLDQIRNNDTYTQSAKQAAEQICTALIRGMNPDRDLHVVVKIGEED
jgi:hypothetical protein